METLIALQEFGLSEKEAKIYLALSKLETAVVSEVAKKSDINRSTAYVLLEALRIRGLVHVTEKNNVQYFRTASPSRFSDLAEANLKASEKAIKIAEILTRDLSKTTVHAPLPTLTIFEGREAILKAWKSLSDTWQHETITTGASGAGSSSDLFKQCQQILPSHIKQKKVQTKAPLSFFLRQETLFYIPDHEEHAVLINDVALATLISSQF